MRTLVVIPARYASTRFPGKPLALIAGKPMVQHVWERAVQCQRAERVVIATEDERIRQASLAFGAEVVMTGDALVSGTDRVHEAARLMGAQHGAFDLIVNAQGDEPMLDPLVVDRCIEAAAAGLGDVVTSATPLTSERDWLDPNIVKVVPGPGVAWYFSRSPMPYLRGHASFTDALTTSPGLFWRHQGLYVYTRSAIERFTAAPPCPQERSESLEQLRALGLGMRIYVVEAQHDSPGIDTPEQLAELNAALGPGR